MAYIGREPQIGNFQVCDAISVVNGQATYALQVGGAAVSPETANHVICSLNGVIQKPGSSFTISSSNIVFSSNLATGDVIDFVQIFGSVLDLGVPSDATVTNAKLAQDIISGETAETSVASDDAVLIHDTSAGALRKMTRANFVSGIGGTNTPAFEAYSANDQSGSHQTYTKVNFDTEVFDTAGNYDHSSNYRFTPTTAGKYYIYTNVCVTSTSANVVDHAQVVIYKNGSSYIRSRISPENSADINQVNLGVFATIDFNGSSDYVEVFYWVDNSAGENQKVIGGRVETVFGGYKLIGV